MYNHHVYFDIEKLYDIKEKDKSIYAVSRSFEKENDAKEFINELKSKNVKYLYSEKLVLFKYSDLKLGG